MSAKSDALIYGIDFNRTAKTEAHRLRICFARARRKTLTGE